MSRSNQTDLTNPATRYFEWSGKHGKLQFYDKEKKENVDVKLPFKFLILDRVASVGGGIKRNGVYEGFWSNVVKDLKRQRITVRSKTGIEAEGLYAAIKEGRGFKFVTGLFIGFYDDDKKLQIGYLKIKGAALNAWIEFTKPIKSLYKGVFTLAERSEALENGDTTYYEPRFAYKDAVSEETENAAVELDKTLQEYLTAYFYQNGNRPSFNDDANGHQVAYSGPDEEPPYDISEPPEEEVEIPW